MDLLDIIESKRFLGGEFLLWLWHEGERRGGVFTLPDFGELAASFDDQLVLEAILAETEQSRLSGGAPADSPEARIALKSGKRVSKARLRLRRGDREWLFTVSAADFSFTSVKVPALLRDPEERALERLSLIDELSDLWAALFRRFLEIRLTADWGATQEALALWARAGA